MKARAVDLQGIEDPHGVVTRVLHTRFDEAHALAAELEHRDSNGLHDFRIAGKRLRYALERFEPLEPSLEAAAQRLERLQDALGEAHDRDVLLAMLPSTLERTRERLQRDRDAHVDRAANLWNEVVTLIRPRTAAEEGV